MLGNIFVAFYALFILNVNYLSLNSCIKYDIDPGYIEFKFSLNDRIFHNKYSKIGFKTQI